MACLSLAASFFLLRICQPSLLCQSSQILGCHLMHPACLGPLGCLPMPPTCCPGSGQCPRILLTVSLPRHRSLDLALKTLGPARKSLVMLASTLASTLQDMQRQLP